jgi:hypothetical protein
LRRCLLFLRLQPRAQKAAGFEKGSSLRSNATAIVSSSHWLETAIGTGLLQVLSKSLNFTFSVTVLPRDPLSSQCRQTFSTSGVNSAAMDSKPVGEAVLADIERSLLINAADVDRRDSIPNLSAVGIAQLGPYKSERRAVVLNDLRQIWLSEAEPEIKVSLAATIVGIIPPPDALPRLNK